jgi:hypothetical protein
MRRECAGLFQQGGPSESLTWQTISDAPPDLRDLVYVSRWIEGCRDEWEARLDRLDEIIDGRREFGVANEMLGPQVPGNPPEEIARRIIDSNLYMVLATANDKGQPWASPVYFAPLDYREFFWVSSPDATHSHNIAARREVGIVVFDSSVPIGTGQGVYMSAAAELVEGGDVERGIEVFSRRSLEHGGQAWTNADVEPGGPIRLYKATASEYSILAKDGRPDHRIPADVMRG